MESKILPSADRLDALDAERFRDMVASPPFEFLRRRVIAELERYRADCERKADTMEIHRAQGATAAIRVVLSLPELIQKELDRPLK